MPPEPAKVALVRQWLSKAERDLQQADRAAEPPPFLDDTVFHCQQATEKALKAFLTWHDRPFRKTHNLQELVAQCAEIVPQLAELRRPAATLTPYAWEFRYPADLLEPTQAAADEARVLARECLPRIKTQLPPEAQPS